MLLTRPRYPLYCLFERPMHPYEVATTRPATGPFPAPAVFRWDCPGCGGRIADHGPAKGPALDQDGHAAHCVRLPAEVADWDEEGPR